MAEQLQAIQRRIKSIESTEKIASAMQLVAAAKLKQATNRFNYSRNHLKPLADMLKERIERENFDKDPSYYTNKKTVIDDNKEIAPSLTIVITGCKGMCGSYNSTILKELEDAEAMTTFLPLGLKGYDHIRSHNLFLLEDYIVDISPEDQDSTDSNNETSIRSRFRDYYEKPAEEHSYSHILNLSKKIIYRQQAGEIAEVHLVYAKYKNSMAYEVVSKMVLPVYNVDEKPEYTPYLAEFLALTLYGAIGEAALNEYGARRLAMKNATDNAEEILAGLETKYHRARQAQITDELIEIISGTESQQALEKEAKKKR
ncbi:MAG: F0F1 ATP synthase subunit gamma [Firmicutes bacterium]|nr:F0F1 ATP synthase subunit gamma [Bacillota bacterium]